MNSLRNIVRYPLAVVFCLLLTLIGCGKKSIDATNSLGQSGYNNAQAGSSQDFTVNVGDRVFFSLDSSSIESDAEYILARQAEWLLRYPHYSITIEGHADERGTREYNLALGQRRAVAVRDHLISLGVSSQRMNTISYGKERPVAVCDNISCWNQNRRAVLVINNTGSY
ncbi:peptidoglycan-associated lipoprotein [Bartonella sp. CDC_skunk]|uniref:peptidoglycan-associated lipoprotein Pal n=1 Tax=Bartonella TaxID=773 RepID=UPI00099ACB56|nr:MULTISPECIES: peptidoglycan-associated lipoprotein Pal [unclassified Bartonella]AQX21896.1 peptidoglycan-associated lipoprotein [Bartonella sp. CDC_skunk]AQX27169.1 peptidoglycan-associated lipoprotein [Bartonella sp. Raccoon60]